jgi:hypothetical protein
MTSRLLTVGAVVVAVAVGAVLLLVPTGRTATVSSPAGPPAPGATPGRSLTSGPARASWVAEENAKQGTSDWKITGPLNRGNVEGFADTTSAVVGDTVRLFVSTDARSYQVEAYRMGWYGGKQGRLVWKSDTLTGFRQAPATVDPRTNMAEARWTSSLTVTPDRSWPPGDYLFKLAADNGFAQYVPLTLRDDASKSAFVVVNAVTTWQAYNKWGNHSLYEGVGRGGATSPTERSKVVSFDRPYVNDSGSGDFLGNELPMVSLLESGGYDVTYWTDTDLHARPELLQNHKALVSLGHDEYWSKEMRDAVEQARDYQGLNVAFFGANALYRAIRLESSPLGQLRHEVNYRSARDDPVALTDKSRATVDWRDPPLSRPESSLVGDYYQCNPVRADMIVAESSGWVFAGTQLGAGDRIPDIVGPEFDGYVPTAPQPPAQVEVLAHSPVRCGGRNTHSDMTYYSTASGAGVFATGTNWWISRVGPTCPADTTCQEAAARVSRNVLDAFGVGPAGAAHPSLANFSSLSGDTTRDTIPNAGQGEPSSSSSSNSSPTTLYPSGRSTTTTPAATVPRRLRRI